MSRETHRVYYPDLRWRGTRSVGCLKPLSSREVLPIAASLSGRDHLLQQDRPLDRGCEHIAPCVRYEPAVPLEQVEHSLDDRPIEDRGARQPLRAQPLVERCRPPQHPPPRRRESTKPPADPADP